MFKNDWISYHNYSTHTRIASCAVAGMYVRQRSVRPERPSLGTSTKNHCCTSPTMSERPADGQLMADPYASPAEGVPTPYQRAEEMERAAKLAAACAYYEERPVPEISGPDAAIAGDA